jgi:hypothetical protein
MNSRPAINPFALPLWLSIAILALWLLDRFFGIGHDALIYTFSALIVFGLPLVVIFGIALVVLAVRRLFRGPRP